MAYLQFFCNQINSFTAITYYYVLLQCTTNSKFN